MSTAVGGIVGGAFNGITSAVGGLGQTVAQTAAPIIAETNPLDAIENQVDIAFRVTSAGIYIDRAEMERNAVEDGDIAQWLIHYTVTDNASTLPNAWQDRAEETLFDAALVGTRVAATRCTPSL